jgi:lipopolysaccharide export system protein LptA
MRGSRDGILCAAVLLVCFAGSAVAEDAKPTAASSQPNALFQSLSLGSGKGPVHIDSDSLELDYKSSNIMYRGHVQVTQGDITMTSDQLSITYDPAAVKRSDKPGASPTPGASGDKKSAASPAANTDKIKEIIAEGNVKIRQGTKTAEGRRAVFDQAKQTVTLSDGAVLHDGPNQVAGERVIVYLQEERSVVESGSNTRVKAVLYPGKEDAGKATASPVPAVSPTAAPSPRS